MLTPAKSLVSLSYQADEVGERMQWRGGGTLEAGISARPPLPHAVEPDSDGGMVVKNLPGRAKWSAGATTKEGRVFPRQPGSVSNIGWIVPIDCENGRKCLAAIMCIFRYFTTSSALIQMTNGDHRLNILNHL